MFPTYALIPRIIRWCRRFRQRRGYGVHSPFAFEWITDVVYRQREQYYAYATLSQHHSDWQGVLSEKDARLLFRIANHMRASRILVVGQGAVREIHYLKAARPSAEITQISDESSIHQAAQQLEQLMQHYNLVVWMAEISPKVAESSERCEKVSKLAPQKSEFSSKVSEKIREKSEIIEETSEILLKRSEQISSRSGFSGKNSSLLPTAALILLFPHADSARKQAWEALQVWEGITLSFDLHRFGVAFTCPRLHRQHYVVNYF